MFWKTEQIVLNMFHSLTCSLLGQSEKNSIIWCHKRGEEDGNRQNNGAQLVSI